MDDLTLSDTRNLSDIQTSLELLERTNPVFNTAKMTLFQLASTGDANAVALTKALGLTAEGAVGAQDAEEQVLNGIIVETRYRTMGRLALESGFSTAVDLPCGYTPRGMEFAAKGHPFVGLDLPAAILEAKPAIASLVDEDRRHLVRYFGVDATNYASLKEAFDQIDGDVCITTEGLLMYFTDSETGQLCDNIRMILAEHGGCWLLADAEVALQYVLTARAFYGDRFMEAMARGRERASKKSDVDVSGHTLPLSITKDANQAMRDAMAFLGRHGLKAERLTVADHVPELDSLKALPEEQANETLESMKSYAFWRITPIANEARPLDASAAKADRMEVEATLSGGVLMLKVKGRLDTLTAPNLLDFFETTEQEHEIDKVCVDCSDLVYLSSAGLRVLMIMRKSCPGGVTLKSPNASVREVLVQTAFDSILDVVE